MMVSPAQSLSEAPLFHPWTDFSLSIQAISLALYQSGTGNYHFCLPQQWLAIRDIYPSELLSLYSELYTLPL
uniref:Uncharacterized protein n=1 Tax=Triticum urartu TaxID=4572 RepID=A0A8R7PEJ8_TRIUA